MNFGWLSTNNPTWLQHVSSNICNFFDSFRYSFHVFDVQLFLVGAQVCDPLISCVWHVNFGWLSTNNPTWLQYVSSIIWPFFASSHYPFHVFDVQLCFVGAQVLETWLTFVCWHVTWNSWIFPIEIGRKCLFNTRFPLFISICAAEKIKSLVCPRSGIRNVTNLCLLARDLEFMDCFHRNSA